MTDGKRHLRSGTHLFEQIYLNAIGRENIRRDLGKQRTVVTAIVSDYNRNLFHIFKVCVQIVRESLGSSSDSIDVHTIGTYAHDPTESARTKLEIFVKGLDQFCLIFVLQHAFHFSLSFGIIRRGQPLFGFLSHLFD